MKKALQISLAGTLFTIEEDGFNRLQSYLESIRGYFGKLPDSKDIMEDIEARIAEQLIENTKGHNNIVTLVDVEKVITSMGSVEEISGSVDDSGHGKSESKSESTSETSASRKLYRNGDDVVIAGVASGLAAYLGIDTLIMRIIFVVMVFATSGGFIFAYIIAALLIPKAETAADKIRMRGGPVTLTSFKETFDGQIHNVKENGKDILSNHSSFRNLLEKFFRFIGAIIRIALSIVVKLVGVFLLLVPVAVCIALIFGAINLIFNGDMLSPATLIQQVVPSSVYFLSVIFIFLTIFIPALFIGSLGLSILSRKQKMAARTAMALGGIWVVSLLLAGTLAIRYVPEIHEKVESLPEFQETTRTVELKDFSQLDLHGIAHVTLVQSDTYGVSIKGRQYLVDATDIKAENGILSVSKTDAKNKCFFCDGGRVEIAISMPNIESITADDIVSITSDKIQAEKLKVTITDAASAKFMYVGSDLNVRLEGIARLTTRGTTTNLTLVQIDSTHFDGSELEATNAIVKTKDIARTEVRSSDKLEINASDASYVNYFGTTTAITTSDVAKVIDED